MSKYFNYIDKLKKSHEVDDNSLEFAETIEHNENIYIMCQAYFLHEYSKQYQNCEVSTQNRMNEFSCQAYLSFETDEDNKIIVDNFRDNSTKLGNLLLSLRYVIKCLSESICSLENMDNLFEIEISNCIIDTFHILEQISHYSHYDAPPHIFFRQLDDILKFNYDEAHVLVMRSVVTQIYFSKLVDDSQDELKNAFLYCQSVSALINVMNQFSCKLIKKYYNIVIQFLRGENYLHHSDTVMIRKKLHWDDIKNENSKARNVAVIYYKGSEYWAINGKDEQDAPNNLIRALKIILSTIYMGSNITITTSSNHNGNKSTIYIVPLHDGVKCYIKNKNVWVTKSYMDYRNYYPNEKTGQFCCSERKLLSILDKEQDGFVMYTLMQPCSKCSAAFRYLMSVGNYNFEVHCEEYDEDMDKLLDIP